MKLIRLLLFPIVPVYYIVTLLRNILYDLNIKKSKSYDFPVICVGNLSAGGTGKTPMVEYLIRLLKDNYKLATLSRGYGRKSTGFLLGNAQSTANDLGDEPFQFYYKFHDTIKVSVDGDRQNGIKTLRNLQKQPEVILLDDAFQHRKVKAGLNILLTTYNNPFYSDIVLPTGNLREPKIGKKRAQIIIVTKCPELTEIEKSKMVSKINPKPHQHVFFSTIRYSNTVIGLNKESPLESLSKFTLITGIANAKPLVDYLRMQELEFNHIEFKDHHDFSEKEISDIAKQDLIITTEKDYMRLKDVDTLKDKLFYLPIESIIDRPLEFNKLILDFAAN